MPVYYPSTDPANFPCTGPGSGFAAYYRNEIAFLKMFQDGDLEKARQHLSDRSAGEVNNTLVFAIWQRADPALFVFAHENEHTTDLNYLLPVAASNNSLQILRALLAAGAATTNEALDRCRVGSECWTALCLLVDRRWRSTSAKHQKAFAAVVEASDADLAGLCVLVHRLPGDVLRYCVAPYLRRCAPAFGRNRRAV